MNDSKGLLVIRSPLSLSNASVSRMIDAITPVADALGLEPMVLGDGADVRLELGHSALLERLCVAVERLVAQGEPPQAPEQIERPTLNRRASGLNSRG